MPILQAPRWSLSNKASRCQAGVASGIQESVFGLRLVLLAEGLKDTFLTAPRAGLHMSMPQATVCSGRQHRDPSWQTFLRDKRNKLQVPSLNSRAEAKS